MAGQQLVVPKRVRDRLSHLADQPNVGPALEERGVVETDQGDAGPLGVGGGLRGQSGELVFGLLGTPLELSGLGSQEPSFEACALADGPAGQAFGEVMIMPGLGRPRPGHEELGAATTTQEAQSCHPQGITPAAPAGRLDHLGQGPGDGALAQGADAGSYDISIDGMAEVHLGPASGQAAGDKAFVLEGLDGRGRRRPGQLGRAERLAQRQQFQ
jgi:hypothetical protein